MSEGQQVIFRYDNPGETFGVLALLDEAQYSVFAQAVGNARQLKMAA